MILTDSVKPPTTFPFDSRELRAFVVLVQCGSFTKAARELSLSQSAVSHSIKALEADAGCRLLDRMGKKVCLTLAGEQLLRYSEKILADMDAARSALALLNKWGHARLRLAANATACQHILPAVFRQFKREFPKAIIQLETVDTAGAVDLLREKQVDLAVGLQSSRTADFAFHRLFADELAFVLTPDHPWIATGSGPVDVGRQNYIFYRRHSHTSQLLQEYFLQARLSLNIVAELGSMEGIREMAKLGLGIAFLPPWMIADELREKTLAQLPLGPRKLRRVWGALSRAEEPLNIAQDTFLKLCRRQCERLAGNSLD
ncbi:MAG TPA: LysR family transcriptional regulator [Verrucomicrobiae bacterium]|jgi:DNA-binding transcriptional LysR family regulator|nr:LysR family transcriptional regulator [Verrucomicrobiae bacterium]